jgi:hypothetical protein
MHYWSEIPDRSRLSVYEAVLRETFGFRKKLKSYDWIPIGICMEKRKQSGKESLVLLNGREIPKTTVRKEVRRNAPKPGIRKVKHRGELALSLYRNGHSN